VPHVRLLEAVTSCPWFGWVYSSLDKELAKRPSAESGGEWS